MFNNRVDLINIALVIISFIIAIYIPFKLFLFSYAVLGPLHYLTEINWLHKQNFYVKENKNWIWIFVFSALIISLFPFYQFIVSDTSHFTYPFFKFLDKYGSVFILVSLIMGLGMVIFNKKRSLLIFLILSCIFSLVAYFMLNSFVILFGYLITTIIHVYLFTILFMAFGSLKSKSVYGWIALTMVLVVPMLLAILPIKYHLYELNGFAKVSFERSNFLLLGKELAGITGTLKSGVYYVLSEDGLKIQMFIAFAYTYHYLNWFSKTSIIGWGKALNRKSSWVIILFWLISVFLYAIDYKLGLVTLFFLSFLHVFAEFPLNWITLKSLYPVNQNSK